MSTQQITQVRPIAPGGGVKPIRGNTAVLNVIFTIDQTIIALYWVLRNGVPYQQQIRELQQQQRESMIRHHLARLTQLGYSMT